MILVNSCNFITFHHSSNLVSSSSTSVTTHFKSFHSQIAHQRNQIGGQPLKGSHCNLKKQDPFKLFQSLSSSEVESNKEEEEDDLQLVAKFKTRYNDIMIVDTAESRLLILDSTCK